MWETQHSSSSDDIKQFEKYPDVWIIAHINSKRADIGALSCFPELEKTVYKSFADRIDKGDTIVLFQSEKALHS